jgi:hypothetical protein
MKWLEILRYATPTDLSVFGVVNKEMRAIAQALMVDEKYVIDAISFGMRDKIFHEQTSAYSDNSRAVDEIQSD